MKNKIKIFVLTIIAFISITNCNLAFATVRLDPTKGPVGLPKTEITSYLDFQKTIANLISPLLMIASGVAIFFIVLGGFFWITSAGNQEQLDKGKKTIQWAIIGFLITIFSYAIIQAVVSTMYQEIPKNGPSNPASTNPVPSNIASPQP